MNPWAYCGFHRLSDIEGNMSSNLRNVILLYSLLISVAGAAPEVKQHVLQNGLKVLVKEDHRAPVVVSQVWYKVGSSYEYGGVTGISHVLEHMMYKGTKNHAPGEFSRIISENGGRENAFTGRDYTAYFQRLEKSRLEVSFELEADRMRNLHLQDKDFQKERQVVLEERRMRTDDKPRSKTYELFLASAHTNGGYRNPVIGWPDDIEQLTIVDLQNWYERWYAPNNATVVVVGDVQADEVFALAEKYFGVFEAGQIAENKPRIEVPQLGARRLNVKLPAELPYLMMGYKVPSLKTAKDQREAYALEVLSGILDGGSSARLSSQLIRGKQIAVAAGASYDLYSRLSSLFMIDATPAQGQSLSVLEMALKDEISRLRQQPVSDSELERVKAQVLANAIYERDSVFYQAMQIGTLETVGLDWQKMDEYVDKVNEITSQDVLAVARKYLVEEGLTIGYLEPLPLGKRLPAKASVGG